MRVMNRRDAIAAARRGLVGLGLGLLGAAAAAQGEARPGSAPCQAALRALGEAEDALAARAAAAAAASSPGARERSAADRQQAAAMQLLPLRQQVANACLGGVAGAPVVRGGGRSAPFAPAPVTSPPSALGRPPASPAPGLGLPLPRIDPPATLSHCVGMHCLGSDGAALTRVGPGSVAGPRGVCAVQGGVLRCP
jgi:hypothetical protein